MISHRYLFSILATSVAFFATGTAHSALIFSDNFDNVIAPPLNPDFTTTDSFITAPQTGPATMNWLVGTGHGTHPNVDILEGGGYHATTLGLCDAGNCVDLDGTGSSDYPYLYTADTFALDAGVKYELTATVRGNGRVGAKDLFTFGFANPNDQSTIITPSRTTLSENNGFVTLSLFFTPAVNTVARLFFQNESLADNFGAVLQKVTLSSVPLPAAVWLLLSGLVGVGMTARRRRSTVPPATAAW